MKELKDRGWKPIPLSLKILFVVFVLWSIGAILNAPTLYKEGLPLLGVFVYGATSSLVVLLLDIVGPMTFLYALWNRKSWAPVWALSYIAVFILNCTIAIFTDTVREKLGLIPMLIPLVASVIFFLVIYNKRSYFESKVGGK